MGGGLIAKSRPAAQQPMAQQTSDLQPTVWRPGVPVLIFPILCPAVNPCTGLHLVWACKIDEGEFESGYHFNDHLNHFRSFLSLLVVIEKHCPSLFIRLLTEPDREEVHCQTIQTIKW